jgi:ADP-ribosylglycohydrolase/predicted enzyme related to lactoylglutathione lyase
VFVTELFDRGVAAFVGAAIGDALGWPQENRSSNVDRTIPQPAMTFRSWRRRGGGRFNSYEEAIGAGEYSDDTQMICVSARSLTRREGEWYDWLTRVELPTFPVYQRGGGRALLAACRAWGIGVSPWQPHRETDPSSYFNAGGNGGAMRVLPHALAAAAAGRPIAGGNVFRDVTATHGHPRAIVGALVHGVALWTALRIKGTLAYGELIDALLDEPAAWAIVPEVDVSSSGWLTARSSAHGDFERDWHATVAEMTSLLITAKRGMTAGALASEQETLQSLGCIGTKTVGSGTVTAAGAVYLASRAAANPRSGLLSAAFLPRADTDTLASMTASILAAVAGQHWLAPLDSQVQDRAYLATLARAVAAHETADGSPPRLVSKSGLDQFTKRLDKAALGESVELTDGRETTVADTVVLEPRTQSSVAVRHRLTVADGQTLHIVRVKRKGRAEVEAASRERLPIDHGPPPEIDAPKVLRVGVKLSVNDLSVMRRFYQDVLGMSPSRTGSSFVTFNDFLALTVVPETPVATTSRLCIYLEVQGIDALWHGIQERRVPIVDPLTAENGRRWFKCLDPEGNVLEVRGGTAVSPVNEVGGPA